MALVIFMIRPEFESWIAMSTLEATFYLALLVVAGSIVFTAVCLILGIRPSTLRM